MPLVFFFPFRFFERNEEYNRAKDRKNKKVCMLLGEIKCKIFAVFFFFVFGTHDFLVEAKRERKKNQQKTVLDNNE